VAPGSPTATPIVVQGNAVPFSMTAGWVLAAATTITWLAIFIDWNQNGLLTDVGEEVYLVNGQLIPSGGPQAETGTVTIPYDCRYRCYAGMRVRSDC
jgi:hypothetical protein